MGLTRHTIGDVAAPAAARRELFTGIVIGLAALWAGIWRISEASIRFDEPAYTSAGAAYFDGDFTQNLEHPPVAKYLFGLAQLVLGDGIDSARVASALASVVIAVVLWRLGSKMFGPAAGVVAAALWVALPRSIGSNEVPAPGDRLERFAYLEPVTAMFMVLALWFGWRLSRRTSGPDRAARPDVVGLGVAVGLATGSKLSGVAIAFPIGVYLLATGGRRMIAPLGAAAAVSAVTFGAAYLPFGRTAGDALSFMFRFQGEHAEFGHMTFVRGRPVLDPPWYTELWYHFDADGIWLTAAVVGLVCVAFVDPKRRREVAYAFAAVAGIYLFLSLLPVQLRHYRYVVWPPLVLVLAAGVTSVFGSMARPWRAVGAASLAVVAVTGLLSLGQLAVSGPDDYAVIDRALNDRGVPSDPVTRGEVASVLVGALGLPAAGDDYFSDDGGSAHESSINALREAGIASGCGDDRDRYCPTDPVTRAELASVLVGALGLPAAGDDYFSDDGGSAHESSINALREAGITRGCRDGPDRYCPSDLVTRAQLESFLVRALGVEVLGARLD